MINKLRNNHIYVLDDLRGIAILAVIVYHYFFVYYRKMEIENIFLENIKLFNDYLNLGAFGVSLFFLVSGFVIPMSLQGLNKKKVVSNFFIRRFFRLYPTYWFAIIFISIIILLFKDNNAYTVKQIFINFTMFQDIFRVDSIDGVFWTLMIELKFYLLTAFLFYFSLLKNINFIIISFLILSIITLLELNTNNSIINAILNRNHLWSYLMLMYLGTSFYFYTKKDISKYNLISLILIVSTYFMLNHYFLSDTGFGNKFGYSLATVLAIISFTILLNYKKNISKVTTFFGNISYSLYLLHQVLGYFFISILLDSNIYMPFAQIIDFIVITLITVGVNKYIEIPSNKIGHKYVK